MKRILSIALVLCMVLSCVFVSNFASVDTKAAQVEQTEVSASTGPQSQIQGAVILHCFNWSYNSIKNNLQAIKDAGYTAVQTSPVQSPKDFNGGWKDQGGQWWKLYQPLDFNISNNTWLGTRNDLKSLCDAAESMGIKVVVDIVANHVANKSDGGGAWNVNDGVDSKLKRDDYYHSSNNWANDGSRYSMTQDHIGMPDLNTAHPDVQNIVKGLLVDCINVGVDGFRFDAAKHIELPTDDGCASNFWPTVIEGSQATTSNKIFYYGEILNGCGTDINNFTKYMSITDNYTGDSILVAANNSNAQGLANSRYAKGATADKSVLWVESHDTHMGASGSAGISKTAGISDDKIIKAWAMVGSRADSSSLFFARPAQNMGDASSNTTYKSKAVAEVNKFKNFFAGQGEHLSSDGQFAYNERGTSGVVIVNASGSNTSVNIKAHKMADGTYKDAVSGGTFTVSGGRITGSIGNTGVAVVYNPTNTPVQPTQPPTQAPTVAPTEAPVTYLVGDTDVDGGISIMDATIVQMHLSKKITLTGKALKAADVDLSSDVNVMDASLIQRHVANVKTNGSYCGQTKTYSGSDNPTPTPTNPTQIPDGKNYVYFKNNDNWSTVNFYYWSEENSAMIAWPGVNMESVGNNEYRAELPNGATKVIFNNGSQQTNDLSIPGANQIYDNGSWRPYGNNPTPTTDVIDGECIYFRNNDNWSEVKIYYWSESNDQMVSWPGVNMESAGSNVYKYKVPSDATMVIFNNGQGAQTSDTQLQGTGKIYDNGNWSVYNG